MLGKFVLDDDLNVGKLLYLNPATEKVSLLISYSRSERFVRWLGGILRIKRLAAYHGRIPIGFLAENGQKDEMAYVLMKR